MSKKIQQAVKAGLDKPSELKLQRKDDTPSDQARWKTAVEAAAAIDELIRSVASGAIAVLSKTKANGEGMVKTGSVGELTTNLQQHKRTLEQILTRVPTEDRIVEEEEYVEYLAVFSEIDELRTAINENVIPALTAITSEMFDSVEETEEKGKDNE